MPRLRDVVNTLLLAMKGSGFLADGRGSAPASAGLGVPASPGNAHPDPPPARLISGQQMDSLGRVTGGVAHDFNNLLTVVLGNAAALRIGAEARGDDQALRRAEQIERAAERGSRLASQLLAFSGRQVLQPSVVSTYDVVSGGYHLLAGAAGEAIRITLTAENNLWQCRVDPAQLESAVLNLVQNARDAMPDGGNVTIRFSNRRVAAESKQAPWRRSGEYVGIDVQDTGSGIPADLLEKVFEPFFTTRPVGQGSGLGLAQVHGFARQSGGWVELKSTVGRGTIASLFLPRLRRPLSGGAGSNGGLAPCQPTVLIVEPDPDIRGASCEALSATGMHTLEASSGSGAITHLVSEAPIELLFTTEALPGGLSGAELGRHARTLRPDLRVLICSHQLLDAPRESGQRHVQGLGPFSFLMKPYRAADLIPVVAALVSAGTFSTDTEELLAEVRDFADSAAGPGGLALHSAASGVRHRTTRLGVLPFRTNTEGNRAFCAGLAEEITTAIAAFRSITCVAPASLAAVAQAQTDDPDRWQQLDLDFLVDGSLRRKDDDIRVSVRLVRMDTRGEIAWSRRFGGKLSDVRNMQDRIAREIAAQVAPQVMVWEAGEVALRPSVNATARDMMLRAIPAIYSLDQAGFAEAGRLLEQSLTLDPDSAECYSWLAHWHLLQVGQGWADEPLGAIACADSLSQRAITLDPGDARGLTVAGHIRAFLHRDANTALGLHERALALNPSLALAWCYAGLAHSYRGNHSEAIRSIQRAQQLSPHDPHRFFFDTALAGPYLLTGDYQSAARLGRKARDVHPGLSSTYKTLLAALSLAGAKDEAAAARVALLRLEPRFCISSALARSPLLRQEDRDLFIRGLRLAGIPERFEGRALVRS